ncbi:hypothetical protein E6O75_ATG03612 [Venturia nashicola]|uniref:Uncharacterized protein n=1 Tax=Venturia nashicola TaxID=86259 RepID=A0A4Z1PE58_9PEZI|nr:hypothetical protein E6O75_ATG03612 [Venturia nashicola]
MHSALHSAPAPSTALSTCTQHCTQHLHPALHSAPAPSTSTVYCVDALCTGHVPANTPRLPPSSSIDPPLGLTSLSPSTLHSANDTCHAHNIPAVAILAPGQSVTTGTEDSSGKPQQLLAYPLGPIRQSKRAVLAGISRVPPSVFPMGLVRICLPPAAALFVPSTALHESAIR